MWITFNKLLTVVTFILLFFIPFSSLLAQDISDIDIDRIRDDKSIMYDDCKYDNKIEDMVCNDTGEDIIQYLWRTDEEIGQLSRGSYTEEIEKRTENTITWSNGNSYIKRIYSRPYMERIGDTWFRLYRATTTIDKWSDKTDNFSLINSVNVDTSSSTGYNATFWTISGGANTYLTIHDSASSDSLYENDAGQDLQIFDKRKDSSSSCKINRAEVSFDTSSFTGNEVFTDATLYLYQTTAGFVDGGGFLCITGSISADVDTPVVSDFNNIGWTATSTSGTASGTPIIEYATRTDLGTLGTNSWQLFTLFDTFYDLINDTGYTQIGLRMSHDVDRSNPPSEYGTDLVTFDVPSGTYPPYIEFTYTIPSGDTPTATSTYATVGQIPIFNDLTVITGYQEIYTDSSTTPSEVRYNYYHIPAFFIFFIVLVFMPFILRIILEIIIHYRK